MSITLTTPNTILGSVLPKSDERQLMLNAVVVLLGSLLLWASAKISVPMWPVPVTLQTFAVAALSAAFGWRVGVATMILYLTEGLSGLPVFTFGGGPAYLFGPTGGFLIGMIAMAFIIGYAADKGASSKPVQLFAVMVLADAVVLAFGFVWLIAMSGGVSWIDQSNVVMSAFEKAIQPFILGDLLKMALAAAVVTGTFALVRDRKAD